MTLVLKNTLTRKKETFTPINPAKVGMYVCGPTVYDRIHIGNARPIVVFDVLYRLLKKLYPSVTYVRNITDVDDKINARARENGEPIGDLTKRTTALFHDDVKELGSLLPDVEPRATEHIALMISAIETLIAKGHAYEAEGHVLFDVPSDPDYGCLSGRSRDEMVAGARVEVAPYKRDPADFVLWKPSSDDLPGWDSPWGRGRPGWHIECSVMSAEYLGEDFDIHGGGLDLVFPHHENEIAQSCCATGKGFAHTWVHNGYLMVEGEKMSKSLGNFHTVRELLDQWPGEVLRFYLLTTQYSQPFDFTHTGLKQAKARLDRYYRALEASGDGNVGEVPETVMDALLDDLNTPLALSRIDEMVGRVMQGERSANLGEGLRASAEVLGILTSDPETWFRWQPAGGDQLDETAIEALIAERLEARKNKDFTTSDRIRDDLKEKGVVLEDGPGGTTWRREVS